MRNTVISLIDFLGSYDARSCLNTLLMMKDSIFLLDGVDEGALKNLMIGA